MRPRRRISVLQALALDQLHREELDAVGLAQVVDAHHVLVRDLAGEHQLLLEALDGELGAFAELRIVLSAITLSSSRSRAA